MFSTCICYSFRLLPSELFHSVTRLIFKYCLRLEGNHLSSLASVSERIDGQNALRLRQPAVSLLLLGRLLSCLLEQVIVEPVSSADCNCNLPLKIEDIQTIVYL